MNYEEFFKFPYVIKDELYIAKNLEKGAEDEVNSFIIGGAMVHFSDRVVSIMDMWLPTYTGAEAALDGDFEACAVSFREAGDFRIPWKKSRFMKEHQEFFEVAAKKKKEAIIAQLKKNQMMMIDDRGVDLQEVEHDYNQQILNEKNDTESEETTD
jgi:hypothetical protein